MNELTALKWLERQKGLIVFIGDDRGITLTDGFNVEISGVGFLDAVVKLQKVLKDMKQ